MRVKLLSIFAIAVVGAMSSSCSTAKSSRVGTAPSGEEPSVVEHSGSRKQVERLVSTAKELYGYGKAREAKKLLEAALALEPQNPEAIYYCRLVDESLQQPPREEIRVWYP